MKKKKTTLDKKSGELVLLAHGGGGLYTKQLIKNIILRHLNNPILAQLDDSACLTLPSTELVFTTDSYVVDPIFFPGGDIGKLSVCGTINDLAMQGGIPRYLSLGLILEEGLPLRDFEQIIISIGEASRQTGVTVVTGDIKVVERGKGNGIFINTAGIGVRREGISVHVSKAQAGDSVLISGTLGDHGMAIMSRRLKFETELISDVAPLWAMLEPLFKENIAIHCLRDPTRGGVASALCDIAEASSAGIYLEETALPVRREVRGACDLLGLDPLNVANEGKALIICTRDDAERALGLLRTSPLGKEARIIGTVRAHSPGLVLLKTRLGGERIIETPAGEDLPRIC